MKHRTKLIIGIIGSVLVVGGGTVGIVHHGYAKNHIRIQRMKRTKPVRSTRRLQKGHKRNKNVITKKNTKRSQPKIAFSMNPSNWRKGTPPIFQHKAWWVTNYQPYQKRFKYRYIRYSTSFSSEYGFNPISSYYDFNKKYTFGTNGLGARTALHPYYQSLGHNFYRIVSGNVKINRKGLQEDLHAVKNKTYGEAILVKVNGINDIDIWIYKNGKPNSKQKRFLGEFQRYPFSMSELEHVLKIKDK